MRKISGAVTRKSEGLTNRPKKAQRQRLGDSEPLAHVSVFPANLLQVDLGDRAKRCLSEGPAPAAYSAVPKVS